MHTELYFSKFPYTVSELGTPLVKKGKKDSEKLSTWWISLILY